MQAVSTTILAGLSAKRIRHSGISHSKDRAGFSTVNPILFFVQCEASLAEKFASRLAVATLAFASPRKVGNPAGNVSLRKGFGFGAYKHKCGQDMQACTVQIH